MGSVTMERLHDWVRIWLENPDRHNCMDTAMWGRLRQIAEGLAQEDQVGVVVIQGRGADFTSGFDLSEFVDQTKDTIHHAFGGMEAAISAVEALPMPVVAVISGYCLGGGLELAMACDLRWASDDALLGMPIARLGIMLSRTFAWRLVRVLGPSRTKEVLFTGRLVNSKEALNWGMVNQVWDPQHMETAIHQEMERMGHMFPRAIRHAKQSVDQVTGSTEETTAYFVDETDFAHAIGRFRRRHRSDNFSTAPKDRE